jgi:hypothetical protein
MYLSLALNEQQSVQLIFTWTNTANKQNLYLVKQINRHTQTHTKHKRECFIRITIF